MSEFLEKCPRCFKAYRANNPYFSVDHAAYFSSDESFALIWCRHCGYVAYWQRAKALGFIKLPTLKLAKTFHIHDLAEEEVAGTRETVLGLFAGAHLVRMIWNSFHTYALEEVGEERANAHATALAFDQLHPREMALMIGVTVNAYQLIPLEHQINEGQYLGSIGREWTRQKFESWVLEHNKSKKAEHVLEMVGEMLTQDGG